MSHPSDGRDNIVFLPGPSDDPEERNECMHKVIHSILLPRHFDGVIAFNDFYALALIRELHRAGIRIPRDIAVAGIDNEPFAASLFPSLTSLDQNNAEIAENAVELLLLRLQGKNRADRRIPPKIVIRESTRMGKRARGL